MSEDLKSEIEEKRQNTEMSVSHPVSPINSVHSANHRSRVYQSFQLGWTELKSPK